MRKSVIGAAMFAAIMSTSALHAGTAKQSEFGTLEDGREVSAITLDNGKVTATVITYGASLQSLEMPDRNGKRADVALGHDDMKGYIESPNYFGSTVGRFANRIAGGRFKLDKRTYQTPTNDGVNSLHGGTAGFDKVLWTVQSMKSGPEASVTLRYVSPDGDQGYPGNMTVDAIYSLNDANELRIEYRATTDKRTIANITNHAYWNLGGDGSAEGAMDHVLMIPADSYLPTDKGSIPTGKAQSVKGTAFDFRTPRAVGDRVRDASEQQLVFAKGYDHNWIVGDKVTTDQHLMAKMYDPASGRGFELWSNQPGLQFYSGNFLDATFSGKSGQLYRQGDAIVLEPQIFPDTPNQQGFPTATLDPGQTYHNVMTYRLSFDNPRKK